MFAPEAEAQLIARERKQNLRRNLSEMLASKGVSSGLAHFFLLAIALIAAWHKETLSLSVSVIAAILTTLSLARIGASFVWNRIAKDHEKIWYSVYFGLTVLSAVCWGILCICFLREHNIADELFVLVMVMCGGVAAAGTASLSPDKILARSFVLSVSAPLFIYLLVIPTNYIYLALMLVVYAGFLFVQVEIQSRIVLDLRDREEQYRALTEASREAVIIHEDGRIIEANPAFEGLFGYPPSEAIGRNVTEFVAEDGHRQVQATLASTGPSLTSNYIGIRRNGERFALETAGRSFYYKGRKARVSCAQDITLRKRAEDAVREGAEQKEALSLEREKSALESVKLKAEFLANMSHEIRTPLNAIIGITDLIMDSAADPVQERYFRTLKNSGETLLNLVNDVLDFSKIDADRLDLEFVPFHLPTVVEGQAVLMAGRARFKGISISTFIDQSLPVSVTGDFGRVGQIILNLVGNAIKFTEVGSISIRCTELMRSHDKVMVRFEVNDTGVGIKNAESKNLFTPFSQADSSTSRKHGGTGLGLSICKRLVDLMGGKIGFTSEPGFGSKFWFELPFEITEAKTISDAFAETLSNHDWSHVTVSVIQDQLDVKDVVMAYLQAWQLKIQPTRLETWCARLKPQNGTEIVIASITQLTPVMMQKIAERKRAGHDIRFLLIEDKSEITREIQAALGSQTKAIPLPVQQSEFFNSLVALSVVENAKLPQPKSSSHEKQQKDWDKMFAPARILVAEDNSTNQMLILALLRRFGFQCHAVANGLEALDALSASEYDLVLMDCQMPELDGFEAVIRLRQREIETGAHVPVLALTANVVAEDRDRCFEAGMDGFISKPIRIEKLIQALQGHLKPFESAA